MAWAPDYGTSALAKAWMRVDDTVDDVQIAAVLTAASRAADRYCRRQFGQVDAAEERIYRAGWDRHEGVYRAVIDDLQDTTGLTITDPDGNAVSSDDYTLGPVNAAQLGKPYEYIELLTTGDHTMSALWGWSAVPASVPLAVQLQLSRFAARRDSPYGVAGSPDMGAQLRLLARLDPDVELVLKAYRRRWWAA